MGWLQHWKAILSGGPSSAAPAGGPLLTATAIGHAYRGADVNKNNNHWQPQHFSGNEAIHDSWDLLTSRCRDMARNDPLFQKVGNQLCSLVIADGLRVYAAAVDGSGNEIDDYNDESDTWWERWAEDEADALGEKSLYELQRVSFNDMMSVGNCLWLRSFNPDKSRISPLQYTLIEWEQLAKDFDTTSGLQTRELPAGHRIINGIEYDPTGRKTAFWIYFDHPYDSSQNFLYQPTRVPAERIIHNYLPSQVSDTTGISWYAAMLQPAKDRDCLIGNTLTSTAVQALLTLVVKRNAVRGSGASAGDLDEEDPDTGLSKVAMGYPFIAEVGQHDDVQVAESRKNLSELGTFANILWTLEAMGSKLSMNRVLGDPTRANMASIRASHEDDDALMSPLRTHQARRVAVGIRKEWTKLAIVTGRIQTISAGLFNASPWRYLSFEAVGSHRGDVSPAEEVQAAMDRMRAGLTTYPRECARQGGNWRANIRRHAQVNEYAKRYGVVLDWTKGQGGALEKSSAIAGASGEAEDQESSDG